MSEPLFRIGQQVISKGGSGTVFTIQRHVPRGAYRGPGGDDDVIRYVASWPCSEGGISMGNMDEGDMEALSDVPGQP
ncbi:MAG: hypothetical protein JWO08_4560 [Verrucomicrobiaceae bacterium]|nr:hypothetical protein [Verrucomicrobiaceae bacterium]